MTLFHRDLGGAGNPPLVLLHGMLGSSRNWQTAGRDLAQAFHVFALDLRNHGGSPQAPTMSYPEMADDVLAWLEAQGLPSTTLLGHSMGGKVAMLLACRHPHRVARLLVVDIAPKGYFWPAHRTNFAALNALDLTVLRSRAEAEHRFEAAVPSLALRKFLATNLTRSGDGGWSWQINLPALTSSLADLEKNPLATDDRYQGPALFLAGEKSNYIEPVDAAAIQAHFPAAQIQVLPGADHNPHLSRRAEFVAAVLGFGI